MTMPISYQGRLPGIFADPALPQRNADRLRLDIAGFVGIAERGPIDTPVLIEDMQQYLRIFGGDFVLANNEGQPVYANLSQAVNAFFDNGGVHCYVVRVVGDTAWAHQFRIPGMVCRAENGLLSDVIVPAAWLGRWSAEMQIGTQLRTRAMTIQERPDPLGDVPPAYTIDTAAATMSVAVDAPSEQIVVADDMVRLRYRDDVTNEDFILLARIASVTNTIIDVPIGEIDLEGTVVSVNEKTDTKQVIPQARLNHVPLTLEAQTRSLLAFRENFVVLPNNNPPTDPPEIPIVERLTSAGWEVVVSPPLDAPTLPTLNLIVFERAVTVDMTPLVETDLLRLNYSGDIQIYCAIDEVIGHTDGIDERQQIQCRNPLQAVTLADLPDTPLQVDRLRFNLLVREGDDALEHWLDLSFGTWATSMAEDTNRLNDPNVIESVANLSTRSLRVGQPSIIADTFFLPLGMDGFSREVDALLSVSTDDADGLGTFDPETLFVDPNFANIGWRRIQDRADELRFLSATPTKLTRLHSLIIVPDVAMVALPDLAHRPWGLVTPPSSEEEPPVEETEEEVCDKFFCPCPPEEEEPEEEKPFSEILNPPDDEDSNTLDLLLPILESPDDYRGEQVDALLTVHRGLIEMCAALCDRVALLSMPQHFERSDVLDWLSRLRTTPAFYDGNPLSYSAFYHGWIRIVEPASPELAPLRTVPPDGAVAGQIAGRELQSGVWVAPANQILRGVVGLTPNFNDADSLTLFDQQANLVAQKPGYFTTISSHTLSRERVYLQLSVRRFLILLREVLLREGNRYVFENNDDRFWRYVRTSFTELLDQLIDLGAIRAYELSTGRATMTQQDIDQGRFIVEIRIAPTQPIEYITIVLLRSGEDILEIVEL